MATPFLLKNNIRLLICYKNFSKETGISHIGLGITGAYSAKTLRANGIYAEAMPVYGADDLAAYIASQESGPRPITHVVICAQWIPVQFLASMLARKFPHITFAQNCHSNVGFLQAEPPAIKLLRDVIDMEATLPNLIASSNNLRLCTALHNMYGKPITHLPNLYFLSGKEPNQRPFYNGGVIRIGCFGSLRVYKNFSTCVAASVELISRLKVQGEIWINSGRNDGAGDVVYRTAKAWTDGLPNVTLKELPWASWADFKRVVGSMNLVMQVSYTETFNNVVADSISNGTPCVVGPSIEWAPKTWIAEPDDSSNCADIARHLLTDPYASSDGYAALQSYISKGLPYWKAFLGLNSA